MVTGRARRAQSCPATRLCSYPGARSADVSLGSVEGEGTIYLGDRALVVGYNDRDMAFSGLIEGYGTLAARLQKVGKGALTLTDANTYTGGTQISGGTLVANNSSGSATGTGPLQINNGTLAGSGTIAGAVTAGSGNGSGSFLAPANGGKPATLTIQSALTFNSDATSTCALQASKKKSANDEVVANGVTINSGAQFNLVAKVQGKLKAGTSFAVISNTASTPISGTFANLADGAVLTVGNTKLQASYEGGDGNDLTLTVVPNE
jgi:autotransporter-associated beta strand protein